MKNGKGKALVIVLCLMLILSGLPLNVIALEAAPGEGVNVENPEGPASDETQDKVAEDVASEEAKDVAANEETAASQQPAAGEETETSKQPAAGEDTGASDQPAATEETAEGQQPAASDEEQEEVSDDATQEAQDADANEEPAAGDETAASDDNQEGAEATSEEAQDAATNEEPAAEELADEEETAADDEAKEEKPADKETQAAFKASQTIDGVKVTVTAPKGAFPEGAKLSVSKVKASEAKKVGKAVDKVRDDNANVAISYVFDIHVEDKNGKEIQPADGKKVKVSFESSEISDSNLSTDVYHVESQGRSLKADALDVKTAGDTATVTTDGFSYYTVEFTYGDLQYVMEGDSEIPLSTILDKIGLSGTVTAATSSNPELFSVENKGSSQASFLLRRIPHPNHRRNRLCDQSYR